MKYSDDCVFTMPLQLIESTMYSPPYPTVQNVTTALSSTNKNAHVTTGSLALVYLKRISVKGFIPPHRIIDAVEEHPIRWQVRVQHIYALSATCGGVPSPTLNAVYE
jgi:hypothetical protein